MYGVHEEWLLNSVQTYILIGNEATHGTKRLLARPHQRHSFPWLTSRSLVPHLNTIYVWDNPHYRPDAASGGDA